MLARAPAPELRITVRRQGLTVRIQDGVPKCLQSLTDDKQVQAVAMRQDPPLIIGITRRGAAGII